MTLGDCVQACMHYTVCGRSNHQGPVVCGGIGDTEGVVQPRASVNLVFAHFMGS